MRQPVRRIACLGFFIVLFSCKPRTQTPRDNARVYVDQRPPTAKDIITAAIASQSVPLSVSPSCGNIGTEPTDATIGRYLAGFLPELKKSNGQNWIATSVQPATVAGEAVWTSRVAIRHVEGDDRWGWGVRFNVRQSDGLVLANSFTCIGAG